MATAKKYDTEYKILIEYQINFKDETVMGLSIGRSGSPPTDGYDNASQPNANPASDPVESKTTRPPLINLRSAQKFRKLEAKQLAREAATNKIKGPERKKREVKSEPPIVQNLVSPIQQPSKKEVKRQLEREEATNKIKVPERKRREQTETPSASKDVVIPAQKFSKKQTKRQLEREEASVDSKPSKKLSLSTLFASMKIRF